MTEWAAQIGKLICPGMQGEKVRVFYLGIRYR